MDAADPRAAGGDTEPCATCGAPMDSGQRYCLSCGARRAHLGGVREGLRMTAGSEGPEGPEAAARETKAHLAAHGASANLPATPGLGGPSASVPGAPAPFGAPTRGSGATAVIASVGVLLLAMGVGVLIGRAGSNAGKAATAPQVISVASPGAGAGTGVGATGATGSTGATTTPTSSTPAHAAAPKSSKPSSGVGSVPSKPAPPTVLKNLRSGGSGQSYEQKSKNLPNVVSTG